MSKTIPCDYCQGTGTINVNTMDADACPVCNGRGQVKVRQ